MKDFKIWEVVAIGAVVMAIITSITNTYNPIGILVVGLGIAGMVRWLE